MADFGLADTVNATEPLFQPVWVPGQVVVDHEVRAALQVYAFARRVVGDHHAHDGIAVERGDRRTPGLTGHAAVDDDHASRVAQTAP